MANSVLDSRPTAWTADRETPPPRFRVFGLAACAGAITLAFVQPLAKLASLALQNDLYSHLLLVPLISGYLLYAEARRAVAYGSSITPAVRVAAIGIAALVAATGLGMSLSPNDQLSLMMLAYVSFIVAGGFLFLGSDWMRAAAFPAAFLVFMIPIPDAAVSWLEEVLVAGSTEATVFFFNLTGTPLYREGTTLTLPGIILEVARECSGIRSSVVLFITSVVAAHLFLRSGWRRGALLAFVAPLVIVRNGLRILVIGLLSVHIGPHMTDSYIHHSGGPIFFAVSLIPLFLLLWWLRRSEQRAKAAT